MTVDAERLAAQVRVLLTERREVARILTGALGHREGAPSDPPRPGAALVSDHTPTSLAAEAAGLITALACDLRDAQSLAGSASRPVEDRVVPACEDEPTATHPHRLELCWTPDQNTGTVSVFPRRYPVTAIIGQLRAGETAERVAVEYELTADQVRLLGRLAEQLGIQGE